MSKKTLIFVATLSGIWLAPAHAQDFSKLAFNIGGGISTPLNPTAQYVGIDGTFNVGAGYNINKKNSITGEFMRSFSRCEQTRASFVLWDSSESFAWS